MSEEIIEARYRALKSFTSMETGSEYVKGMLYEARDQRTKELFEAWAEYGLLEPMTQANRTAQVGGAGVVT